MIEGDDGEDTVFASKAWIEMGRGDRFSVRK